MNWVVSPDLQETVSLRNVNTMQMIAEVNLGETYGKIEFI